MGTRLPSKYAFAVVGVALAIGGCARVANEISAKANPHLPAKRYLKILVAGRIGDSESEELIEKNLVDSCREPVQCIASTKILHPTKLYTPQERLTALRQLSIEGVLMVTAEGTTEVSYIPRRAASPGPVQATSNHSPSREADDAPAPEVKEARYRATLYDVATGEPAWIGKITASKNFMAGPDDLLASVAPTVVAQLVLDGFFIEK